MMRLYYDRNTGEIITAITASADPGTRTDPYVNSIDDNISIDSWKVNVATGQLYAVEPPPRLQR